MKIDASIFIAFLLLFLAVFTNYWSVISKGKVRHHQGLWKRCSNVGSGTCRNIRPKFFLKAIQVINLLIIFVLVTVIASSELKLYARKFNNKEFYRFIGLLMIFTSIVWILTSSKIEGSFAFPSASFYIYLFSSFIFQKWSF